MDFKALFTIIRNIKDLVANPECGECKGSGWRLVLSEKAIFQFDEAGSQAVTEFGLKRCKCFKQIKKGE